MKFGDVGLAQVSKGLYQWSSVVWVWPKHAWEHQRCTINSVYRLKLTAVRKKKQKKTTKKKH